MGHDIIAIGNHKLNTTSLHTTAIDLSEAFDVSVSYGYADDWIDLETGKEGSFQFIELGRIERNNTLYFLRDSLYTDRLHTKQYADETEYDFYGADYDETSFYVYPRCIKAHTYFDSRWWNFVRYFQGKFYGDKDWVGYINNYRQHVYNEIKRLGGSCALYGDDQGDSYYIIEDAMTLPFDTIAKKLKNEFGNACLAIPHFQRHYAN
jgi:hypothetical protein